MIGLIVVLLTFFWGGEQVSMGILGNGCGTQGENYVELLQESGMTAGYYYTNWILCL